MALEIFRGILWQRCAMYCITLGLLLLVFVPSADAQSTSRDSPPWLRFAAVAVDECPPDELTTLRKIIPMYIHWHYARHAEWLQEEVVDPILEAITKEEATALADAKKSKAERDKRHGEMNARMVAEDKARSADTGTFMSWAKAQWGIFLYLEGMFLEPIWIWEAAATMLIGAALFKWGVIQGSRSTSFYLLLTLACYGFGLTVRAIGAFNDLADYDGPSITWATQELARLATTLGHIGLVHLLLRTAAGAGLLKPFEAAGRTALTLYIAQTIICLWILYPPFALGLYGKHSWAVWMLTAVAVNAPLLWAANVYLRHYRIAPIEWAWRSILAGRSLPIRRSPRSAAVQPA